MEDRTRFEVLLENVQRDVKVIAEGYRALSERLDRFEIRLDYLESRVERIAIQVAVLDAKVHTLEANGRALGTKVNALASKLDSLSADTQHRLERIETQLSLDGPPHPRKRRQRGSSKRRKAS